MNGRFDDNVLDGIKIEYGQSETTKWMGMTIGNNDDEEIINKIFLILHNLASLKDHLKNCLKSKGQNQNIVEDEINKSLHLQVLIDLVNQEKHGYPLTKSNRSGKNPLIRMPREMLNISSSSEPNSVAGITLNQDGTYNLDGESKIKISAIISDENKNTLFKLDELVETCYEKFKSLAAIYNCC